MHNFVFPGKQLIVVHDSQRGGHMYTDVETMAVCIVCIALGLLMGFAVGNIDNLHDDDGSRDEPKE